MFSALALASHMGGPGFGPGFILFPLIALFWIGVVILIVSLVRRRGMRGGWGHGYGHPYWGAASRGAESTLAERFAQGDIDEKEYRARLEVLRANNTFTPPAR